MKKFIFALTFLFLAAAHAQSGNFKGYKSMDLDFKNRIFDYPLTAMDYGLISLMGFPTPPADFASLLGLNTAGDGSSPNGTLPNSAPNALNMVILQMLFDNISKIAASQCAGHTTAYEPVPMEYAKLKPEVKEPLNKLCQWPLPVAQDEQIYRDLFDQLTGYEVPQSEFDAWYERFVVSGAYAASPADEFVHDLFYTLFLNPHFLLKK